MPQARLFGRNWTFATDEFVYSSITHFFVLVISVSLYVAAFIYIAYSLYTDYAIIIFCSVCAGISLFLMCEYVILCFLSARGSIMEVGLRKSVPKVYIVTFATSVLHFVASCIALSFISNSLFKAVSETLIQKLLLSASILSIVSSFIQLIHPLRHIAQHGRLAYRVCINQEADLEQRKAALDRQVWAKRLGKLQTLSTRRCSPMNENDTDNIERLTDLLAFLLSDMDFVLSDITVGIMLLRYQSCKWLNGNSAVPLNLFAQLTEAVASNPKSWLSLSRINRVFGYVAATYGWLLLFYGSPSARTRMRSLLSSATLGACCACCSVTRRSSGGSQPYHVLQRGWCKRHDHLLAALLANTDCQPEDIIYAAESSDEDRPFYQPTFVVCVSHELQAVVIAFRGTFSLRETLVDLVAVGERVREEELPADAKGQAFLVHAGILNATRRALKQIDADRLIERAYERAPEHYGLVVAGHSLGGGAAHVLALFLRDRYPGVKVYGFGTPLGTMS